MAEIKVAEQFYSIQGEGPYAGTPAIFLRLAGCNLSCGAVGRDLDDVDPQEDDPVEGASWVCDTIDVWKDPENTYTAEELADDWYERGWLSTLGEFDTHIVLTGGEPMLPAHQEAFVEFYDELSYRGVEPFVEVETNGTQVPDDAFDQRVDQYNVSLKLSNSGHSEEDRINQDAIHKFRALGSEKARFKFVASGHSDVIEIQDIIYSYGIDREQVMLMPAGQTREQLETTYQIIAELCKMYGFDFSPRLHVNIWDQQTGV